MSPTAQRTASHGRADRPTVLRARHTGHVAEAVAEDPLHDIRALHTRIDGQIVLPGDPDWDDSRHAWNLAVDQWPFAVAFVHSPEDVVEIVGFARRHGLRVAAQGTGHGASTLAGLAVLPTDVVNAVDRGSVSE